MKWITQLGSISQFGVRQRVVYNVAYNIAIVCIYDDGDNTMTTLTSDGKSIREAGETKRENGGRERRSGGFYRERKDRTVNR